jgi:hypothetical protein
VEASAMKISICGSMAFLDQFEALAAALRADGFTVCTPVREEAGARWEEMVFEHAVALKAGYVSGYLEEIRSSALVLIANYAKGDVAGYVGANSLIEAAFGFALGKPVVFLFEPGEQPCRLEALALMRSCLNGDISNLRGIFPEA